MSNERCETCDRSNCGWWKWSRAGEVDPSLTVSELSSFKSECVRNAVDWRARALAAEALLRRARLYVAAYWNSDAPIDKRDAAGDVYRAIVSLIDPKDAALCLPGAGEDKKR